MKGPQEQYTDEMEKYFGYYATWNPGLNLALGDIGTFKDNVFTKISDLDSFGVKFEVRDDPTKLILNIVRKVASQRRRNYQVQHRHQEVFLPMLMQELLLSLAKRIRPYSRQMAL